jgi:hypothetical protein
MPIKEADEILGLIDTKIYNEQDTGFRNHLGASSIGNECLRALWYTFRWATRAKHKASLLRLFQRGHLEEDRFIGYLENIGVKVFATDPETGEQWRIKDVFGHFGGSMDSILYNVPFVEQFGLTAKDPVLGEYKTHGQKSFDELVNKGLAAAKPEHYQQMQVYMTKRGIKLGLYMAVNKNTDELKLFWVIAAPMVGAGLLGKAHDVITAPLPPMRINNSPSWFKCRFCDHRGVCHMGEPMEVTCRSCAFSKPIEDGQWYCSNWQSVIPYEHTKIGCPLHSPIKG